MKNREKFVSDFRVDNVFIIPVEVAGYSRGLAEGLSKLGKSVSFIEIVNHRFADPLEDLSGINHVKVFRENPGLLGLISWYWRRLGATMRLAQNADLVIVQAATGLLPFGIDLLVYKLRRIAIVSLCGYGSEARAPQVNHPQVFASSAKFAHLRFAVSAIKLRWKLLTHYWISDFFFASPQISELVPGPFLNFLDLGHPISDATRAKATGFARERKNRSGLSESEFRIIHAPSSLSTKGTFAIRQVVELLKAQYKNVTYREVTNLNHGELLAALGNASLLIDQAYSDYPLPVTSAEAMLCGTPAIVGGYYARWNSSHYSHFAPPSISCTPEGMFEGIEKLILQERSSAIALSRAGVDFVNSNFTSERVASRLWGSISGERNSGISRMKRPNPPYLEGLGAKDDIIQNYRDHFLSRLVLPEFRAESKSSKQFSACQQHVD